MCDLHDHHGLPPLEADEYVLDTPFVRELVATVRETIDGSATAAEACERIRPAVRAGAHPARLAPGRVQAGRARQRHGWRHRPVAPLPLGRPLALPVQPRRAARLDDPDPRPPGLGARRSLPGQSGRGVLRSGRGQHRAHAPAAACTRRLLRAAAAGRRRPPRADDLGRDVGLDPPAGERHGVHRASHLRRADGRRAAVSLRLRERRSARPKRRRSAEPSGGLGGAGAARGPRPPSTRRASLACSPVSGRSSLHFQLWASVVPGRFIRASLPRPSRSWAGMITSSFSTASTFCSRARCSSSRDVAPAASCGWCSLPQRCHQPASVSESWVEV